MDRPTDPAPVVLLIDGDVLVRHAIADYLRGCGYRVIEAASTDEGATVLDDPGVPLAVMLCDAEAPGTVNAFGLRRRAIAQPHRADLRIVMAGNVEAVADKAADLCDDGPHMARPYDPQGLADHIRRLLAGMRERA